MLQDAKRSGVWLLFFCTLVLLGCGPQNSGSPSPSPAAGDEGTTWAEVYMAGSKVGYQSTAASAREVEEKRQRVVHADMYIKVRNPKEIIQRMTYESVQDDAGRLVSFRYEISIGQKPLVVSGRVEGQKILGESSVAGPATPFEIDCPEPLAGLDAVEQSLLKAPLAPEGTRELSLLFSGLPHPSIAKQKLVARNWENLFLGGETRRLLRIDSTVEVAGKATESQMWCDEQGVVWKDAHPSGQVLVRCTQEKAQSGLDEAGFDILAYSTVKAALPARDPAATRRAVYRVRLANSDPRKVFAAGLSQEVKTLDERTAELIVRAVRPDSPAEAAANIDRQPEAGDREPNSLIQSDDAAVVAMAKSELPDEQDPWKIATAFERLVRAKMKPQATSQAFASAAETAKTLTGDCTEYGVLLAALCRARGIPARVALGLVYYRPQQGFSYHLWTEVWIKDRWVPLDATQARGGIGADHIKISDTNLKGGEATGAFLPVLSAMGQMKLEVVEVE